MGDRRAALRVSAVATKAYALDEFASSVSAPPSASLAGSTPNEVTSWKVLLCQLAEGNIDANKISRCALKAACLRTELDILLEAILSAGLTLQKVKPAIASKLFPGLSIQRLEEDRLASMARDEMKKNTVIVEPVQDVLSDLSTFTAGKPAATGCFSHSNEQQHDSQISLLDSSAVQRSEKLEVGIPGETEVSIRQSILCAGLSSIGAVRASTAFVKHETLEEEEEEDENEEENEAKYRRTQSARDRRKSFHAMSSQISVSVYRHIDGEPAKMYELDVAVGQGTFGHVRRARHKKTGQTHAIKTIKTEAVPTDQLWNEIALISELDHPHIMRIYYTFEDNLYIHIASELCSGGELFDAIVKTKSLPDAIASFFFKQCMSAVTYLHQRQICHRDIKPENFLLTQKLVSDEEFERCQIKLIDFGTAKNFRNEEMRTKVCTVHYVAPEVLHRNEDPYTEKVDVWSCGVMLFVMLSGSTPFLHDDDQKKLIKRVKKGKYEFKPTDVWDCVSDSAKELIRHMMTIDPNKRFTAFDAFHHSWTQHKQKGEKLKMDGMVLHQMREYLGYSRLKKIALHVIARQVPDDTIEQLRVLFINFDKDTSGTLTVEEMAEALTVLRVPESVQEEVRRLIVDIARSFSQSCIDDDTVNYTSFIAATMRDNQYLNEKACRAAFLMLDMDGDGRINHDDVLQCLRSDPSLGLKESITETQTVMQEIDQDGDGSIDFDEFVQMMHGQIITRQKIEEFMRDDRIANKRSDSRRKGTKSQEEIKRIMRESGENYQSDSSEDE